METIGIYPKDDGKPYLGRIQHDGFICVFKISLYVPWIAREGRKEAERPGGYHSGIS